MICASNICALFWSDNIIVSFMWLKYDLLYVYSLQTNLFVVIVFCISESIWLSTAIIEYIVLPSYRDTRLYITILLWLCALLGYSELWTCGWQLWHAIILATNYSTTLSTLTILCYVAKVIFPDEPTYSSRWLAAVRGVESISVPPLWRSLLDRHYKQFLRTHASFPLVVA